MLHGVDHNVTFFTAQQSAKFAQVIPNLQHLLVGAQRFVLLQQLIPFLVTATVLLELVLEFVLEEIRKIKNSSIHPSECINPLKTDEFDQRF